MKVKCKAIRELRIKKGLSLEALGKLTNLSQGAISNIENGKTIPHPRTAKTLSDILKVPFDDLFTFPDEQ